MIVTDGMENSSKEYDYPTIKKMISKAKEKGLPYILFPNIEYVYQKLGKKP